MNTDTFDVEQVVRDYLAEVIHMSLATCADNKPWVCEVHFAYDDNLNIYFRSLLSRRHSQEIAKNPFVAGNIVKQHLLNQPVRAVYFEGSALLLTPGEQEDTAAKCFKKRLELDDAILEDAHRDDGHKFYKISVSDFYVFDSIESKPSTKYHLPWAS